MKPVAVPLQAPQWSALDELPDPVRALLREFADDLTARANWMVRKKRLLDILLTFDEVFSMSPEERRRLANRMTEVAGGSPGGAEVPPEAGAEPSPRTDEAAPPETDEDDGDAPSIMLIQFYAGTILEQLAETSIRSAEQAACYALSVHPEHHTASLAWVEADPRNAKALRKLLRADRDLASLFNALADLDESRFNETMGSDGGGSPPAA